MKVQEIVNIVDKNARSKGSLIGILGEIQSKYSHLPEAALKVVADRTGHSLVDIYGVATFYKSFSMKPRGKHLCSVCMGTACHVRNAPVIVDEFERQLKTKAGETTEDKEFTLETVACLGACALGPIVVVDGRYFANVNTGKVKGIIKEARSGAGKLRIETDQRLFPLEVGCPKCNHSLMEERFPIDGHPSIQVTMSFGRVHGWLRLSCVYGSYAVEYETKIPQDTIVDFFCPHCHAELTSASDCATCAAPMVPMIVRGGGMLQICSRRMCRGHMLDLNGVNL